eukprot:18167-Heterococcus_DN1.PRE.1
MHFCATGMMRSIAELIGSSRAMPSCSDAGACARANSFDLIYPNDAECLSHLTDITCKDREDLMGFTLEFHFETNPYFTNTVLTKTYETANLLDHGEPLLESVKGTEIQWHSKKNLCEKTVKQKAGKPRGRNAQQQRVTVKTKKTDSFFKFFMEPIMADMDDEEEEDEESAPYELNYEVDYEVALVLRNHIVPNAILWYTGEAVSDDEEDDDEGDEDFDPEDHDDNSSDNDDTTALTASGATASGAAEPIDPAAGDAECKQS